MPLYQKKVFLSEEYPGPEWLKLHIFIKRVRIQSESYYSLCWCWCHTVYGTQACLCYTATTHERGSHAYHIRRSTRASYKVAVHVLYAPNENSFLKLLLHIFCLEFNVTFVRLPVNSIQALEAKYFYK